MSFQLPLFAQCFEMPNRLCKVCGDRATIKNYGALTCSSCKTFFRRNGFRRDGLHPQNIPPCVLTGNCEITIQSRRYCTACRLAKCFAVGMTPDLIRKEDFSKRKHHLMLRPDQQLPTLNLLSNDQSSLTSSDWTLLSNVVHAFDRFTAVTQARSIVQNFHTQSNLGQSINLMSVIYFSLESFINSVADFRIMTIPEQRSLIERNMHGLWSFYGSFTCLESGVFDNGINENILIPLYGTENIQQTKRLATKLDQDLTLFKLMLITLTFSSNLFAITERNNFERDGLLCGTFRIFGSQNVYVELMWNYMVYRYGFNQSVRRFSILIQIIVGMIQLGSSINDSNEVHHQLADEIIEKTERSLSLNEQQDVPLWGKT